MAWEIGDAMRCANEAQRDAHCGAPTYVCMYNVLTGRWIGKRFSLSGRPLSKLRRSDSFGDLYWRALPTSSWRWFANSLVDLDGLTPSTTFPSFSPSTASRVPKSKSEESSSCWPPVAKEGDTAMGSLDSFVLRHCTLKSAVCKIRAAGHVDDFSAASRFRSFCSCCRSRVRNSCRSISRSETRPACEDNFAPLALAKHLPFRLATVYFLKPLTPSK